MNEVILYISLWYISFLSLDIFYKLSFHDENIKKLSKKSFNNSWTGSRDNIQIKNIV